MSKIEWTDKTWSPITGCTKISPGCKNCNAERMSKRLKGRFGYPADDPFRVTLHRNRLKQHLKWNGRLRIFVCSMGDLFHESVPIDFIMEVIDVAVALGMHRFLFLTKRPEKMKFCFEKWFTRKYKNKDIRLPMPNNLWLGVTAENQEMADERIPILLQIPAAIRFVSVEPMLGPVCLGEYMHGLDQVIVGGESGHGARPMHPEWVRSIRDQCVDASVPFFFKQWGEWSPDYNRKYKAQLLDKDNTNFCGGDSQGIYLSKVGKKAAGRLLDGRTWDQMPE